MPGRSEWRGFIPAAVSAFCFSTSPVAVRYIFTVQEIDALALLSLRFMIGAALLWALPRGGEKLCPSRGEWPWFLLALAGMAGTSIGTFLALRTVPAAMVVLLFYTYPAYTGIFARLWFKERLGLRRVGALLATLLGAAAILGLSTNGSYAGAIPGLVIAASCGLFYSLFSLASQQMMRKHRRSSNWICRWAVSGTALILLFLGPPAAWLTGGGAFLFWGLYLGVVTTFVGYSLYLQAVRTVGATRAGLYSVLEPFFVVVLARLFLGEALTGGQMAGAALVLFGVFGLEGPASDRAEEPQTGLHPL